ncbi:MAG TPA: response regulator transcription factor [Blastocatellia bacterium]|nr:response regulator transcription factor [Blastocatellia bacterium]
MRVAIIEDNPHYRRSLEMLFTHAADFSVAASFGSGQAALAEVERLSRASQEPLWDLVLMDLDLPGLSGLEATRALKKDLPGLAIVVLTVFEEPKTILEAISAGADGYLLKKASAGEILSQLRMIVSGGAPLTAGVARTVLDLLRALRPATTGQLRRAAPARLELTEREQEVLQCLVRGLSYKQAGRPPRRERGYRQDAHPQRLQEAPGAQRVGGGGSRHSRPARVRRCRSHIIMR